MLPLALLAAVLIPAVVAGRPAPEPPALSAPMIEWARYYYDSGKYDKAKKLLTKHTPATGDEAYLLAEVYDRQEKRDSAIAMFARAFELGNAAGAYHVALAGAEPRRAIPPASTRWVSSTPKVRPSATRI